MHKLGYRPSCDQFLWYGYGGHSQGGQCPPYPSCLFSPPSLNTGRQRAVAGDAGTFLAVTSGRLSPEDAVGGGALRVEGGTAENPGALLTHCLTLIGPSAG